MTKVTLTSAQPLSSQQKAAVVDALTKKHPAEEWDIVEIVNSEVLGGVKVTVGSQEMDSTLKTKFDQVRTHLLTSVQ